MPSKTSDEDKVAKLHQQLREGVAALATSEDWQQWLAVAAQFRRYSVHNTFLILLQKPDATRVAGYKAWQKLGRQVRKGEQGIAILAPVTRTIEDEDTGEQVRRVVAFRGATVFDLSQTDGEPLPQAPDVAEHIDGDEPDGLWDALICQAADAGFTVTLAGADRVGHAEAKGACRHDTHEIVVRDDLDAAMRCKTLAHELAHALLHGPEAGTGRARAEVEAESVAYIVCEAVGLSSHAYSFGYVTSWSGGDPDVVQVTAQRVMHTAQAILAHIEPRADAQLATT